jgi:alpha-D-ribose 1-methylphosphonate 5-triphosphate synthase subunit PhnG
MSLLASAKPARLAALFPRESFPHFAYLRKPETGLVMLRGRIGGRAARRQSMPRTGSLRKNDAAIPPYRS